MNTKYFIRSFKPSKFFPKLLTDIFMIKKADFEKDPMSKAYTKQKN